MSDKEILRNQAGRLGVIRHFEEVTKSILKTSRYFGISRAALYRWPKQISKISRPWLKRPILSSFK